MKKIVVLGLALILALALTACGGEKDPAPSGDGTTDPGTSQQTPSGGEIFDITDDQINAADENYYSTLKYLQGDERAAMLAKIPAEIKKAIGTVGAGLCVIQPSRSGEGYLFGMTLYVSGKEDYKTLTDYYKSLGGTVTDEAEEDTFSQLNIEYSWGTLSDCLYQEKSSGDKVIHVSFDIN